MIARTPRRLGHDVEAQFREIKVSNERFDRADRVRLVDVVIEALRQERDLRTIRLRNEPLHAKPPAADSLAES
jgi:hypothetical protein